ncbi:hypothetical protein EJB05_19250, partial [Eragrostis curvula]
MVRIFIHVDQEEELYAVTDFFLYKAGPVAPSLHLIPGPYPIGIHAIHVGVLPCCGGDHCLVVVPQPRPIKASDRWGYVLHIFSTKTMSWTRKKAARMAPDMDERHLFFEHDKVFAVGDDALAWVDFRHGILICAKGLRVTTR